MEIQARAKINWTLDVVGVRQDGYHLLDTLMQPLALHDTLTFAPSEELSLRVAGAPSLSHGDDNLILKAARALQQISQTRSGAAITLKKRIPMGAGLGGGSADCAAALKGLNAFWQLNLDFGCLCRLGEQLGADVPFCLHDAPRRVQGIGEQLTPLAVGRTFPLVPLQPCAALSTREVFTAFHQSALPSPDTARAAAALEKGDLDALAQAGGNVLESASIPLRPEIRQAKSSLARCGARYACMTGSGSVVFGAFDDVLCARKAWNTLKTQYDVCLLTETAL